MAVTISAPTVLCLMCGAGNGSRKQADIVQEVKQLVADGVVEVTLLGQNVNSYGLDLQDGTTFAGLLQELDQIEGLRRIRYMTSHPKDLTEELVKTIAESSKVVDHFHLPVQSGSSRVLDLMNRRYTKEHYLHLIDMIRKYMPDAAISTDIIVGFPGKQKKISWKPLTWYKKSSLTVPLPLCIPNGQVHRRQEWKIRYRWKKRKSGCSV